MRVPQPEPARTPAVSAAVVQLGREKDHDRKPRTKHDRKHRADLKREGLLHPEPSSDDFDHPDARLQGADDSDEDDESSVVEAVSKQALAADFTAALHEEGLKPFLSGGAAIAWQGGSRPIADLDFRVAAEEAGFNNFFESKGAAVFSYINRVVKARLRERVHVRHAVANEFKLIGEDALTIGTSNWFGVEISLSVVPRRPAGMTMLSGDDVPSVEALDLDELLSDKLKTMITRTKKGAKSIKKVSQDIFDFLDLVRLINLRDAPPKKPVAAHLATAIDRRLDEYTIANLEGMQLHHVSDGDLRELMRARAVLTAQAHIKGGARQRALQEKIHAFNPRLNGLLTKLASIAITPHSKATLRPWMQEWNTAPRFGPPRRGGGRQVTPTVEFEPEGPSATELLAQVPSDFLNARMESLNENSRMVLRVLYLGHGFRPLDDAHKNLETLHAVGLTESQFNRAFRELRALGLVQGSAAGLSLTAAGHDKLGR
jgi:hypothetical protein